VRPVKPRWRQILVRVGIGFGAASVLAILTLTAIIGWYGRKAGNVDPGILRSYRPPQVTRILARDGTLIGEIHTGERRTVVAYDALPPALVHAFLAAEDADFFEHDGLDWPSIVRATVSNLIHARARQGGSTITQQVIKNTLLSQSRSVERKSQEIMLAGRVESTLTKREIFEIYVNQIYFGEGRYGVVEAARYYFGKSLDELDLGEMATLAALPNAPGVVTCYRRVERLEARRDYVLAQLVKHGFATPEDIAAFVGEPIVARDRGAAGRGPSSWAVGEADEFVELARLELVRRYGEDGLATLGATVRTTVDLDLQREARAAGRRELAKLEARHGYGSHARTLTTRARKRIEGRAPKQLEVGRRETVIIVDEEPRLSDGSLRATLGPHAIAIELGPEFAGPELLDRFPPGSAVEVRILAAANNDHPARASFEAGPELALALAEVRSGELLALIGGREFRHGGFDRARLARRQPGSSFKPVLYGAALRSRQFTAASTLPGGPTGAPMRLRGALAQSDNAVALALMQALGPEPVHAFARDLGIETALGPQPSLALGTSELPPLELLTAYLTLARGGVGIEPQAILAIDVPSDLHGVTPTPIADAARPRRFGVGAEIAAIVTSMLRSVVDEGTGKPAQALGRPVAGKTGTTDEARDAWFAGFTTDHVAVTWVGFDHPMSLGRNESGSSVALPIWLAAMTEASAGHPAREFPLPRTLETALIDRATGEHACREQTYWYVPERCSDSFAASIWGDRFRSCAPAHWAPRAAYQRCVSPERWLDELFLAGTGPAAPGTASTNEVREVTGLTQMDPHERGGPAPIFAAISVRSLTLFEAPAQLDSSVRTKLDAALARLRTAGEPAWGRACAQARRHGWTVPADGTRLRVSVRLDGDGRLASLRSTRSSGATDVDLLAEAVLTRALQTTPIRLPGAALEPRSGEAELELEFVIGGVPEPR
jgi:penicillin-binding protein 1A